MSAMNGMHYAVDNDRLFRASPDDGTTVQLYPRLRPPTSGATGWIEPSGVPLLTGVREMAAGHGSIYLLRDRDGNGAGEAQSSVRWIDRLSAGGSRSGFIPPMGDGVAPWELPDLNPDFHPPFPILTGSSDWSSPQLSERAAGLVCAALSTVVFDRGAAICITPVGEAFTLTPLGPPSEEFRSAVTATETGLLMELGGLLVMWPEVAAMATQPTSAVAVDFVGATGEHLVVEALVYVRPHAFALVAPRGGFGQSLWRVTVDDESFADPGAAQVEPLELFRWLPSTTVRHLTSIRGSVFTIEDSLLEVGRLMRTTARPDVEADIDPIVERLWWTTMGGRRGSLRRWRLAAQPGQLVGRDHQFRADAPVCSIARHE
jgi:hypothetical protein